MQLVILYPETAEGLSSRSRAGRKGGAAENDHKGRAYVRIADAGVTLSGTAMGAINDTFGVSLPSEVKLGTATVLARVAR